MNPGDAWMAPNPAPPAEPYRYRFVFAAVWNDEAMETQQRAIENALRIAASDPSIRTIAVAGVIDDEAAVPCVGCVDGLDVALGVLDKCVARSAMNCCP
jgi:hypothetical protein